ncbi:MAG: hypothetical protein ACFCVK_25095 [Acidimicrobiales bacterium]
MRLLRLDLGSSQRAIDLHPFVTIVRELDSEQRVELVGALRALARGSTAGIQGLVQHQGLLVELDGYGDDRVSSAIESSVVIDVCAARDDDLPALDDQLAQLRRRVEIDTALVEEIRADLDLSACYEVAQLERRRAPVNDDETERRNRARNELREAVAATADFEPIIREAPPGVIALTGRLRAHGAKSERARHHIDTLRGAIDEARRRLDEAERQLLETETAIRPVFLSREEEARLEMLSFPSMDDSRRGRWKNRLRHEEEVEKQSLLDKVGVENWTAYTMYRVSPSASPERLEAAERARTAVETARIELGQAEGALTTDRLITELNDEMDAIRSEARHYLGMMLPNDLTGALGELIVETPNAAWQAAVDRVVGRAIAAGVDLPSSTADGPDRAAVLAAAVEWLDRDVEDELDGGALERDLAAARDRLARHERALARIARAEETATAARARVVNMEEQLQVRTEGGPSTAAAVLALVEPVAQQLRREARGSLPLAVVADFEGLAEEDVDAILDRLDGFADEVQIIVLTDHEGATSWGKRTGLERCLVSRAKASGGR